MIMGIDHGYYAIKTRHFSFPAGVTAYTHEPYTLKNTLQIGGKYYVCGTGRQPILRDKTVNDNYCCFSKRMRKVFRKNEKSMLQNCNKTAKRKGRLQRVKKPM